MGGLFGGGGGGFKADPSVSKKQLSLADKQSQEALVQQQQFLQAVQAQNGLQNQSQVYNQLQGVADGTGPNPAQAMLANSTGANVANQAAMMAGQRGSSANPGLIARQAAMQGSQIQQQAAGQGAALQAQQSLNAMGAAGNMANQQAAQQAAATSANTGAAGQYQSTLLGAKGQTDSTNATISKQQLENKGNLMGNLMGAAGSAIAGMYAAPAAAAISQMAHGGSVPGPRSKVGMHFGQPMMAAGGAVPALVSPGEQYLDPTDVSQVAKGKDPLATGERIPGKPKVKGNSYANDTVPKTLKEGGIVIPNSVMQSKNPSHQAKKFVAAILAKKGTKLPKDK